MQIFKIYAKCEWFNPSGSVKDHLPLHNMIKTGLASGDATGKTLIDATSGNTGIHMLHSASMGLPVELALPENASEERKLI